MKHVLSRPFHSRHVILSGSLNAYLSKKALHLPLGLATTWVPAVDAVVPARRMACAGHSAESTLTPPKTFIAISIKYILIYEAHTVRPHYTILPLLQACSREARVRREGARRLRETERQVELMALVTAREQAQQQRADKLEELAELNARRTTAILQEKARPPPAL